MSMCTCVAPPIFRLPAVWFYCTISSQVTYCLTQRYPIDHTVYYLLQKLNSRKVTLKKTGAIPSKEKPKFLEAIVPELMSSEDSEDDDGSFVVRPLPWRSSKISEILFALDEKHDRKRSRKSRMMKFQRLEGLPSERPQPIAGTVPNWCIKTN